jgi:hypothetical protein
MKTKKKRGRTPNAIRSVRISLTGWLNPEFDADILDWLESIPKGQRMNALRTALRSGGMLKHTSSVEPEDDTQQIADEILGNWEF